MTAGTPCDLQERVSLGPSGPHLAGRCNLHMGAPSVREEAVLAAARSVADGFAREGWAGRLVEMLAHLGSAAEVDRAYIFQNVRSPDGRLWMDLVAEWDADDVRQIFDEPGNHLHPYAPDFSRRIEVYGSGHRVIDVVENLPEPERSVLLAEGVRSVASLPLFVADDWWGYIGFDDCSEARIWGDAEIEGLTVAAAALTDALHRDLQEQTRRFTEDQFRSMVEEGPAIVYIDAPDESASSIYMSPQVERVLGYLQQEWYDDPDLWPKLLHPDDRARALAENERHNETGEPFSLEYRMFHKDGHVIWVHDEATMVRDERGMPRFSQGVMMDISERKRGEDDLAFQTYHDELTGLPSRSMFEELLELSIARAARHDGSVAVACVDIDDFRLVNDSLGHQSGDELLKIVADRLREATRETDLVARRGGDQFLMLIADLERDSAGDMDTAVVRAEATAQRVQQAMAAPFVVDGTELYLSVSVGISLFPQDAEDAGGLQRNADAAMYESKKAGPAGYMVSSRGVFDSAAKLQFVTRLRKAVESQRWALHYQPILELATGRMVGVEALIRWIEPDGTMVPPIDFIPLAEELGLIELIGDWVVRELVYQGQAWQELGIDLEIGFNLSPRQFWQPDLSERILSRIRDGAIDPSRVMVEITETSAMMDPDRAQEILWQLHGGGLRIAIDDFGTGYSSLSRLREMPVSVLKIDRSFVSNADTDAQSASIVSAFLELARGLEMTTLAEGIETEAELAFLKERGCQLGQGFLFSRPVPPEEIIAFAFGGVPRPHPVTSPTP
jgi:diguanylate cyclase (GGDEF)-like protein/PAS domain S-box-containing protein